MAVWNVGILIFAFWISAGWCIYIKRVNHQVVNCLLIVDSSDILTLPQFMSWNTAYNRKKSKGSWTYQWVQGRVHPHHQQLLQALLRDNTYNPIHWVSIFWTCFWTLYMIYGRIKHRHHIVSQDYIFFVKERESIKRKTYLNKKNPHKSLAII